MLPRSRSAERKYFRACYTQHIYIYIYCDVIARIIIHRSGLAEPSTAEAHRREGRGFGNIQRPGERGHRYSECVYRARQVYRVDSTE